MNNEEKARAYDEALERARKQRDEYQEELDKTDKDSKLASILRAAISAIELAFPELVESDDERIRKKIVGCLRLRKEEGKEFFGSEPIDNCIAYLEKQKEQKTIAMEVYEVGKGTTICGQDYRCKKDYKEGNCWYIKNVIYHCSRDGYLNDQNGISWSCTPEWFNEYFQSNTEWAEEEKTRFVSGQFLQCKLSFDEFKEGEHYWLEYVGDDMYVGRSDNVLNQKFHITPRQLYTLFSQQLEEVQEPPQEEKQVSLNYEPPFDENPSDKEIIEALIKHLKEQDGFLTAIDCVSTKAILTWLEKQKEYKPSGETNVEPDSKIPREEYLYHLLANGIITFSDYTYLMAKKPFEYECANIPQKDYTPVEQKPADLSEMMVHKEPYIAPVPTPMIADEQKSEWSEEDEKMLEAMDESLYCYESGKAPEAVAQIEAERCWLHSLPERFNLQPKQEWSEEDEKDMAHIIRILDDCYVYGTHDLSKTDHENLVNKLKSLRPSWKPNEEQMKALYDACCIAFEEERDFHPSLSRLYHDLRKL